MSDVHRIAIPTTECHEAFAGLQGPDRRARMPRRFASAQWFGLADVAAAPARPPLWRRAEPVAWQFQSGLRGRLVFAMRPAWH